MSSWHRRYASCLSFFTQIAAACVSISKKYSCAVTYCCALHQRDCTPLVWYNVLSRVHSRLRDHGSHEDGSSSCELLGFGTPGSVDWRCTLQVSGYSESTHLRDSGEGTRVNPSQIEESVNKSLARLGTDHIDLLQAGGS